MRARRLVSGFLCCLLALPAMAENNEAPLQKKEKKGSAIITVFSDFHTGFGRVNDDRGFDLDRAYIGYQYNLPHGLQLKAVMDFGQSDRVEDYQRIGHIKNAQITWQHG